MCDHGILRMPWMRVDTVCGDNMASPGIPVKIESELRPAVPKPVRVAVFLLGAAALVGTAHQFGAQASACAVSLFSVRARVCAIAIALPSYLTDSLVACPLETPAGHRFLARLPQGCLPRRTASRL